MEDNQKPKRKLLGKLTDKYRLVIMNDETFEERLSLNLSRLNVLILFSVMGVAFGFIIYALFIFTPLKEYIPGYGDVHVKKDLVKMKYRSDSLETMMDQHSAWIANIINILEDNIPLPPEEPGGKSVFFDTIKLDRIPVEDALLREEIESELDYALIFTDAKREKTGNIYNLNFFPPLKGYVTSTFNPEKEHYGIDIVGQERSPILATLDGTVVFSGWTAETGHVIALQHAQNMISFYKHNSVLLKKVGNFVKAGEPVAIIGNSGELSTGPHLHFELWKDGTPVDPEDYLIF